jgi:hypothetical protein
MSGGLDEEVAPEAPGQSQLDVMLDALIALDIQHTMVVDEAGTTLDIESGARGTFGFSGFAITFNFGPDESFLFIGLARE